MESLKKVAILGAGVMGAEIGLCFAIAGKNVVLKEPELAWAEKAKSRLAKTLATAAAKGRFDASQVETVLARIEPSAEYASLADANLVVEAVFENFDLKKQVLAEADKHCPADCIIASNTSSIPISLLATAVEKSRRSCFIGAHFFAPAFVMKLVEVIPALETSEATVLTILDACRLIGKTPIRVKDTAGFAVNRLLFALFTEAARLVDEGVATCEDIDTGCRLGLGHPIGPFALMDLADLGMGLDVGQILRENYGDRFLFSNALRQKVNAGHLGRKVGQGWYRYE